MNDELYDICRMKLLYVDDDLDISRMVATRFAKNYANQKFFHAENGQDGLRMVELHEPDLIIVDFNMPLMNGLQFLREVKRNGNDIEIATISACKDQAKILECLQSGFRYFIMKPINFEIFFNQTDRMMESIFWKRLSRSKRVCYSSPDTKKHH
jgi:two-component system, response regulator YesN